MKMRYGLGLLGAFVVQSAFLGWMVADRAILLANGAEVRLKVVPVDPRDLFRGDYVTLAYEIERLDTAELAGDDRFDRDAPVYVTLEPRGEDWAATAIARQPPDGGTFIAGRIVDTPPEAGTTYRVSYGLERFFVPEGTGRELERLRNDQRVSVDVAVDRGGRTALKRLLVDGEPRFEEPLY
jgi:uncharacterized membrane-anchored protein